MAPALIAGSHLYQAGVKMRYALYGAGVLRTRQLDCPVVSIGNIAVGGTGKTPMTLWLARRLVQQGLRPVVISGGYKGRLKGGAAVVSDGRRIFLDAGTCGDEPYMMAAEKAFPLVVGRDRYSAGRLAMERFSPDVILLDDGFQHLQLARDLNLVLLDYNHPLGNGRMLPAGRLRETLEMARRRIDAIVFTRAPMQTVQAKGEQGISHPGGVRQILTARPDVPVFFCAYEPFVAHQIGQDTAVSLTGKTALLFSGLARNASFAHTVQSLGIRCCGHLEFCDHYRYTGADMKRILDRARRLNADALLTTEKDWVRIDPAWLGDMTEMRLGVIGIRLRVSGGRELEKLVLTHGRSRCQQNLRDGSIYNNDE